MAGLQPMNLGNVLAQAEGIKGSRITNALNQQKLGANAMGGGGGIEFGKINPRDFTPESLEIFRQSQNFNDLNRYERFRTGKINGALHLIDVQGEQAPIPLSTTQSESEANLSLAAGTERGKLGVQSELKPGIESDVLTAKKDVELVKNPLIKEAEAKAGVLGKRAGQIEIAKPKRIVSALAEKDKTARLKLLITKAKTQATNWTTGFLGSKSKGIPGTPAFDLSQTLSTLQANAGFDRLQEMRNASITGGALGQVSERELALLVDSYSAIGQSQSKAQFIENLDAFEKQLDQSWSRVGMAYELDYGEKYTGQALAAQDQPAPEAQGWTIEEVK